MLRIISETDIDGIERFRLDGRLAEAYVGELGRVLGPSLAVSGHVVLDVSGLTYVDADGARLLKELLAKRVRIHGCSSFVAHLLGIP